MKPVAIANWNSDPDRQSRSCPALRVIDWQRIYLALIGMDPLRIYIAWLVYCFLLCFAERLIGQERLFRLHTTAGVVENAYFEELQEPLNFIFRSGGRLQTFPASNVVRWGAWQPPQQRSALWLVDGSWIVGQISLDAKVAKIIDNDWLNTISVPLAWCRGIVVAAPIRPLDWHRLKMQMESATGEYDFVWMQDRRKIHGVLVASTPATDTPADSPSVISIETSGRKIELDLETDVQAIVFSPALQSKLANRQHRAAISLRDGSLLHVSQITRLPSGKLKIHLEIPIEVSSRDDLANFATSIDYIAGVSQAVTWLSDLEPALYRHLPTSSLRWDLGRDRDLFGRPLSIADSFVAKGLAMHSPSQCAYRWDGSAGKFLSEIIMAAPPEATSAELGSVQCKLMLVRDGKLVEAFKSPTLRTRDRPLVIEADITGAQSVVLITDQADAGSLGDHVLWLDSRFVRAAQPD